MGQQRCVHGNIIGSIVSVTARTVHVDDTDIVIRHSQDLGDRASKRVSALAVGPDRELAVDELCHRSRWTEGRMHVIGPVVCCCDGVRSLSRYFDRRNGIVNGCAVHNEKCLIGPAQKAIEE